MLRVSGITASAAAHGTSTMLGEAAPPSGSGPFARLANLYLTSARDIRSYKDIRSYNLPDGQTARRPDGQTARRPDGQTARRPDGQTARRPDGQTARRPDGQTARRPDGQTARRPVLRASLSPAPGAPASACSTSSPPARFRCAESANRDTSRPWPVPHGVPVGACHTTDRASRVAPISLFHACRQYPGGTGRFARRSRSGQCQPSPTYRRVSSRNSVFEPCSAVSSRCGPRGRWIALGDPLHRSASNDVVASHHPLRLPVSGASAPPTTYVRSGVR